MLTAQCRIYLNASWQTNCSTYICAKENHHITFLTLWWSDVLAPAADKWKEHLVLANSSLCCQGRSTFQGWTRCPPTWPGWWRGSSSRWWGSPRCLPGCTGTAARTVCLSGHQQAHSQSVCCKPTWVKLMGDICMRQFRGLLHHGRVGSLLQPSLKGSSSDSVGRGGVLRQPEVHHHRLALAHRAAHQVCQDVCARDQVLSGRWVD